MRKRYIEYWDGTAMEGGYFHDLSSTGIDMVFGKPSQFQTGGIFLEQTLVFNSKGIVTRLLKDNQATKIICERSIASFDDICFETTVVPLTNIKHATDQVSLLL